MPTRQMGNETTGILEKTVKWLSYGRKFHICIHDMSGILMNNDSMKLPPKNRMHKCSFCDTAKLTAAGLRCCLKSKFYSLRNVVRKRELFVGQCYLGISEIIKPVFWNNRLICVIYLGNLLIDELKENTIHRIKKMHRVTGIKEELLHQSLNSTEVLSLNSIDEYKEVVEVLNDILLLIMRGSPMKPGDRPDSQGPEHPGGKHWAVELVKNYVAAYSNMDLKLSHLARLLFINPQYLCRLFKKEMGINFSDYVNRVRIENAKELIEATDNKILEISHQVGFNNVTYFNKLFKHYIGVTPGEFRKTPADPVD